LIPIANTVTFAQTKNVLRNQILVIPILVDLELLLPLLKILVIVNVLQDPLVILDKNVLRVNVNMMMIVLTKKLV